MGISYETSASARGSGRSVYGYEPSASDGSDGSYSATRNPKPLRVGITYCTWASKPGKIAPALTGPQVMACPSTVHGWPTPLPYEYM